MNYEWLTLVLIKKLLFFIEIDEWPESQHENLSKSAIFNFNPQNAEVIEAIMRSQSSQEIEQSSHENNILSVSDHTIIGSLSQISNIGSNNHIQSNEINLSASPNFSPFVGSAVQSTPSPEIIQT